MEGGILFALAAMCAVILVLLVITMIKLHSLSKGGTDGAAEQLGELIKKTEESRIGTEMQFAKLRAANEAQSAATSSRLDGIVNTVNSRQLETVKLVTDIREDLAAASRRQSADLGEAVRRMQESNEKKLDEMRATVDEKLTSTLSSRLDSSFKSVSEQLQNVYKSLGEMKELSDGIGSLNRMFTGVKLRGTWAEAQLEAILDKTVPGMYVRNFSPKGGEGTVEFAVTVPDTDGGITFLPIDSKFPAEDYIRLTQEAEAGNAEGVKNARLALARRVLNEAKNIKKYISPPETTPFAVMYLATDALYAEVISLKENVVDRLHDEFGIMLAGPSTVTALLSSLAMGFKTVALNKKAAQVMDILAAAKQQYDKFAEALDKARRKIEDAGRSLDDAQKRNDIINKRLKCIEAADGLNADEVLGIDT